MNTEQGTSFSAYSPRKPKKRGKARRIVLIVVLALLIVLGVLIAVNFKTLLLLSGHGSVQLKSLPQIKQSLTGNGLFDDLSQTTDSGGNQVLTGVSKDGAVAVTVTQDAGGKKTVDAQIDLSKLDTGNIDKSALLHGDPSALQAAKAEADQYVGAFVDPGQLTGLETYMATQALSQYKQDPNGSLAVDHAFGGTSVNLSGNPASKKLAIQLKQ